VTTAGDNCFPSFDAFRTVLSSRRRRSHHPSHDITRHHHDKETLMSNSVARNRRRLRWLHLGVGGAIGTYVYLPVGSADWLRWALMLGGVPFVTFSGVAMWKPALFRRRPTRPAVDPAVAAGG
jgi:hypothetical protein